MATINPSEFNIEKAKERTEELKISLIDGIIVNSETEPDTWQISRAIEKNEIPTNKSTSLNEKAEMLLGVVDCAVSSEEKEYSLITTCDDAETIENENILDLTSYEVQPEAASAKDKFTNDSDPFYNLDDDIPDTYIMLNESVSEEEKSDFVCLTAKLYSNDKNSNNNEATTTTTNEATTTTTNEATTTTTNEATTTTTTTKY